MKKLILTAVILFALTSCGNNQKNVTSGNFHHVVDFRKELIMEGNQRDTLNMGRLNAGEIVEFKIGIQNPDSIPMTITNVYTGCGCASADFEKKPVRPGETGLITITYDSQGQNGMQFKHILVETSLYEYPYSIYLMADVKN